MQCLFALFYLSKKRPRVTHEVPEKTGLKIFPFSIRRNSFGEIRIRLHNARGNQRFDRKNDEALTRIAALL